MALTVRASRTKRARLLDFLAFVQQLLDSDQTLQSQVFRLVDFAHAACAQAFQNTIV
jgi:hypothetical protein